MALESYESTAGEVQIWTHVEEYPDYVCSGVQVILGGVARACAAEAGVEEL